MNTVAKLVSGLPSAREKKTRPSCKSSPRFFGECNLFYVKNNPKIIHQNQSIVAVLFMSIFGLFIIGAFSAALAAIFPCALPNEPRPHKTTTASGQEAVWLFDCAPFSSTVINIEPVCCWTSFIRGFNLSIKTVWLSEPCRNWPAETRRPRRDEPVAHGWSWELY